MRRLWSIATITALTVLLVGCAEAENASPPQLPAATQAAEGMAAIGSCLESRGWDVIDATTGQAKVPNEQMSIFQKDLEECVEEFDGDKQTTPLNDEELTELYALEKSAAECLTSEGHPVEVPSLQVYIDRYKANTPFVAHAEIGPLPPTEAGLLNEKCPPTSWMFEPKH